MNLKAIHIHEEGEVSLITEENIAEDTTDQVLLRFYNKKYLRFCSYLCSCHKKLTSLLPML